MHARHPVRRRRAHGQGPARGRRHSRSGRSRWGGSTIDAEATSRPLVAVSWTVMPPSRIPRRELLALGTVSPFLSAALAAQAGPPSAAAIPSARRAELYSLMGKLPDRHRPIRKEKVGEEERDGYVLERWVFDLNGIEPVPAFLARPRTLTGRAPGRAVQPFTRGRLHDRQAGVRGGSQLPAADAVCEGADRPRLRRALHRPLGLRRAQPWHGGRHFQGHALAGPGALGHDGVRQPAGARRPRRSRRMSTRSVSRRSGFPWAARWPGGWRPWTSG